MRFALAVFLCLFPALPAGAASDCGDLHALARRFYADAGLSRLADQPWFGDCVHPAMRGDRIWSMLEDAAVSARNAGLDLGAIRETHDTLRLDIGGQSLAVRVTRDRDRRIIGLDSYQQSAIGVPFSGLARRLQDLPGRVSLILQHRGKTLFGVNSGMPLQVSSTMKLAVLKVLLDDSAAGRLRLTDTLELKPELKALPSGSLQQLPDGTPLTVASLAALMMRDSDNTASDMLIDRLGAGRIAAVLGLPQMMTFHQWFMLKGDRALYDEYRRGDTAARGRLLAALKPLPLSYSDTYAQATPEAGWHVPARRLCELIGGLAQSDLAQLESAYVQYAEWRGVAAKAGGDETSRNDTVLLTRHDGEVFCMSVTWNSERPIDNDQRYTTLVTTLLEALRRYDVRTGAVGLEPF